MKTNLFVLIICRRCFQHISTGMDILAEWFATRDLDPVLDGSIPIMVENFFSTKTTRIFYCIVWPTFRVKRGKWRHFRGPKTEINAIKKSNILEFIDWLPCYPNWKWRNFQHDETQNNAIKKSNSFSSFHVFVATIRQQTKV